MPSDRQSVQTSTYCRRLGDQGRNAGLALGGGSSPVTDSTRTLAGSASRSCRAT
jgi:hypothetical protein